MASSTVETTQSESKESGAQAVLVEESREAGAPAFQFDPNAPPEEKAAVAKSAIPSDLKPETKPKAVPVATDLGDAAPDKHNLPSGKATTDPVAEASPPANENLANGQLTEAERFDPHRTGWAPRFAQPPSERRGEDRLDHQTLLEGSLDDKFFGGWYHDAAAIIFACLASWLVTLLGGGLGWIFFVMAICGTYYRTSNRRVRRNLRDDVNREMAKQRLETDTESLEWINSFLEKFWPIYAPVLADTIIQSVDQVLSTTTPNFLDSMRLKTFIFGTKPPRLEHVKTYPKTETDILLMDWKFGFTPTDVADMTKRQLQDKINPKVVLEVRVGMGVVSKGLDIIVQDFAFSGEMRVKIKFQVAFPHIERIEVCFLHRPEIDYVCKPLGGETLGFDINFIPGLESFIKELIHSSLEPVMYAPHIFPVEIAKILAGSSVDQAIGVVALTLHGASHLKNSEMFGTTTDPYALVTLDSNHPLGRTRTIHDTTDPRWEETLYVLITSLTDTLMVHVYDYNDLRKDRELGAAAFALEPLGREPEHENLQLDILDRGRSRGTLHADVRYYPVLSGRRLANGQTEPPPELNTGIVRFTVEQAKELDTTKSLSALNPYAALLLNGQEIHTSDTLRRTSNPIFRQAYKEILITDRKNARLGVAIKDSRDLVGDVVVGQAQMKLNDMLKMMEQGHEWYPLTGARSGRVKMTLAWKPVALRGVAGAAVYIHPIGVMRLQFRSARDLRNLETMGKSDPYVRVLLSGMLKARTVTFKNNLNPEWDEVVYVPVRSRTERLTLEVMDEESVGKDRSLGETELSISEYVRDGELAGEYEVNDDKQPTTSGLRLSGRGPVKGFLNYTVAFYPTFNVVDPEEEAAEEEAEKVDGGEGRPSTSLSRQSDGSARKSLDSGRPSADLPRPSTDLPRTSTERSPTDGPPRVELNGSKLPLNGDPIDTETASVVSSVKPPPKVHISAEDLGKYESGLVVFKLIEGHLSQPNVRLEVLLDDHMFPAYTSQKVRSKDAKFGEVGDGFVRELDMSQITLRLVEKIDNKDETDSHTIAKLTGQTLPTLQRCLYTPTELVLRSNDGGVSKVKVSLRYIPVKMKLDPTESINNSGTLRVDVLDAADLPSADRNGFSDPYCKFKLAGKEVYKTKVQKKTLHPAWNEFFETPIKTRIGADFKVDVYDWDFGDRADYLGGTPIDLEVLEPFQPKEISLPLDGKSGAIRLKFLFKSSYVVRAHQGSSTFSGTFATPGKIVGAPVKGVGIVGGGVVKGATFLGRGLVSRFRSEKDVDEATDGAATPPIITAAAHNDERPESSAPVDGSITPQRAPALLDTVTPPAQTPSLTPDQLQRRHSRTRSIVSQFGDKLGVGGGNSGSADVGTATISILSAGGFPPAAHVRVQVKLLGPKGPKDVHKTKAVKASSGSVQFDQLHETCRVPNVTGEAQYQLRVVDHATFGSDEVLGETLFFVDDQGSAAGKDKSVKVGPGQVVVRSSFFAPRETSNGRPNTAQSTTPGDETADSPDPKRLSRRGFLTKRTVSSS
jgi:Ca2+-dependent lipid-binding protein